MADGRITIDTKIDQAGIDKGIQGMQKTLKGTASKLKSTGKTMSAAITAPIVGLGTVAFAAADQVEKAYANIRAGTGATGDDLEDLKESFREVFADVPQSADEVSNVLADLNTLTGATGDTLEDLTKAVLDASRAMGIDSANLTQQAAEALNRWSIEAEDGVEHMDKLFKVSQDTGIGMDELARLMADHRSTLEAYGLGFDEAAVFIGEMEKAGFDVNGVIREMRSSMKKLAEDGEDPAEAFEMLTQRMLDAESQSEATSIAQEVFGSRAADVAQAVRDGSFNVQEMAEALNDAGGIIAETGEDTLTFGEKLANLKNQAQLGLEPVGEILIDLAEKWLPPVINLVQQVAEWFQNLSPTIQKVIVVIGGIIAVIGPLLVVVGMLINAFVTILPIIKLVGAAIGLLASPIGLIIAAVVALVAVIVIYWEEIWAVTKTVFSAIGDFFVSTWEWIKETFNSAVDGVSNALEKAWNWIKDTTSTIWNGIVSFFSDIWDNIVSRAQNMKDRFLSVWEGIKNGIRTVVNPIIGFINRLISGIENMVNAIARGINRIPSFNIPDWVPGIGGGTFGLPDVPTISLSRIPSLAVGTNFVAKDGLAYLHRGEAVVPKEYNPAAGGGGVYEFNIEIPLDGETVAKKTVRFTARELESMRKNSARGRGIRK